MSSLSVQSGIGGTFTCPSIGTSHKPRFNTSFHLKPKAFSTHSPTTIHLRIGPIISRTSPVHSSSATIEAVAAETTSTASSTSAAPEDFLPTQEIDKKPEEEEVISRVKKPKLVLKFIWMEKNIGLGLDQAVPGHGTVPLSPYYFWPRKDAWEELKTTLESKPWISQKTMIILLNQATDIINLWQQSGGNLA